MASDWCVANAHPDFAAAWRDVVEPGACDAAAEQGGGLFALWELGIGSGLPAADIPACGDIAVVEAMGHAAGAIFTGDRWAIEGARALHFLAPEQVSVLKAWRV